MPVFEFICYDCEIVIDHFEHNRKNVPGKLECPSCSGLIGQNYAASAGFVLKGEGWAGKTIKRENEGTRSAEKAEQFHDTLDTAETEAKEILNERRKGKRSFKEFAKHNKEKIKRYSENKKRGYVGPNTFKSE